MYWKVKDNQVKNHTHEEEMSSTYVAEVLAHYKLIPFMPAQSLGDK